MTCKRNTETYELDGRPLRSWQLTGPAGVAEFRALQIDVAGDAVIDGEMWMGVMLGLHTPGPQYDGHELAGPCDLMDDAHCYYAFSATAAARLLREWADTGDEATVWAALECEYAEAERLAVNSVGR